ncbi:hypothetical protein KDD30_22240 (plasmid) [Photobacterium sp. GJ3]|uniref:hypothetical protein n=1 Tax=Photobacterium sp. GJ3 TaxID=2829502 RepID=UPI001B8CB25D|nr:hypothetical protein [Photobacterium sp. GJ3]QUJ70608.1 hypothetical protein KDD30_22240 [Photobacterium sp. GJ3]
MNMHFLDISLNNAVNFPIFTLGPKGTSSEYASHHFSNWMKSRYSESDHSIFLKNTYEEARDNLHKEDGLLIVANAYSQVNDFYMDPKLTLLGSFLFDTPMYGLATKNTVADRPLVVASHPAPIPLIRELLPEGMKIERVVEMKSTSAAAAAVVEGQVDLALTTEVAAGLHQLKFISRVRPIHMLWSVFSSTQPKALEQIKEVSND